ncbi:MAG: pyrimidine dimer DNA glycosylase/endonuclease V [Desulfobacterales bacterium]|nr:pyrimidine dimer DNA glycosylase/endonuclease V [Desulfobacterales bacterium]MDX2511454.1 pyrimidine dimer DNA glycosylase/endonuclease V [Desulfobacterales bacterium]
MRLWTLHPRYLDSKGLVALWREGLLAQAVLNGHTKGYRHHPQLIRFQEQTSPLDCIAAYLKEIHREAQQRTYQFNKIKILSSGPCKRITETRGQIQYEWRHLKIKLRQRDPDRLKHFCDVSMPKLHPLFKIVEGDIREWEKVK